LFSSLVCSTTGNGDAPENADSFWRAIKKRTLAKDLLTGLKFAVLGLGDSNYDKFCFMGKALDKRFCDLGASRLFEIFCADESTNLEEIVEAWKAQCLQVFQQLDADRLALDSVTVILKDIALNPSDSLLDSDENASGDLNNNIDANIDESNSKSCEEEYQQIIPTGVLNINQIVTHFKIPVDLAIEPEASLLPKSRKHNETSYDVVSEGKTQIDLLAKPGKGRSGSFEWTVANPFVSSVNSAKWLTKAPTELGPLCPSKVSNEAWESARDVILVDLNIHLSGIQYQPGDSIAICVPNPEQLVTCLMERLQSLQPPLQRETIIRRSDGEELSVSELLTYRLDLVSVPRKAVVLALADCCQDANEANALRWTCCKGDLGKTLWKNMFEDQCVGVGELIALYPSCTPSLNTLISILSPLPPRAYSIATSPLLHPSSVSIALSLVRYCCVSGGYQTDSTVDSSDSSNQLKVIKRSGLCTSYLHHLLKRWLYPQAQPAVAMGTAPLLRVFHKPSATFRLPGSVASPLILIGPGTGVAPFIGFLSHRAALEKERKVSGEDTCTGMWRGGYEFLGTCDIPCEGNRIDEFLQHVVPGSVHLYFGCRTEHDWIFRVTNLSLSLLPLLDPSQDTMEMRLEDGTLSVLETALSRIGPEKTYVTHRSHLPSLPPHC
jgi:methionine synthase reductase